MLSHAPFEGAGFEHERWTRRVDASERARLEEQSLPLDEGRYTVPGGQSFTARASGEHGQAPRRCLGWGIAEASGSRKLVRPTCHVVERGVGNVLAICLHGLDLTLEQLPRGLSAARLSLKLVRLGGALREGTRPEHATLQLNIFEEEGQEYDDDGPGGVFQLEQHGGAEQLRALASAEAPLWAWAPLEAYCAFEECIATDCGDGRAPSVRACLVVEATETGAS